MAVGGQDGKLRDVDSIGEPAALPQLSDRTAVRAANVEHRARRLCAAEGLLCSAERLKELVRVMLGSVVVADLVQRVVQVGSGDVGRAGSAFHWRRLLMWPTGSDRRRLLVLVWM